MFPNVYFSQTIPMTSSEAIEAAEAWYESLAPVGHRGGWLRAGHRLRLRRGFAPMRSDPLVLRRALGVLWTAAVPVSVELALVAHSEQRSELALHPFDLRWPVGTKRYGNLMGGPTSSIRGDFDANRKPTTSAVPGFAIDVPPIPCPIPSGRERRLVD